MKETERKTNIERSVAVKIVRKNFGLLIIVAPFKISEKVFQSGLSALTVCPVLSFIIFYFLEKSLAVVSGIV